ncbi:hypothetical protein Taro_048296, partial [Colocasia esculenta]|nr:hypothetical protein [Colocasia esculenta]
MVAPARVASRPCGVSGILGGSVCRPSTLWRSEVAVLVVRCRSHLVVAWSRWESCVCHDLGWWSWRCTVLFHCLVVPCCRRWPTDVKGPIVVRFFVKGRDYLNSSRSGRIGSSSCFLISLVSLPCSPPPCVMCLYRVGGQGLRIPLVCLSTDAATARHIVTSEEASARSGVTLSRHGWRSR